ncbi:hypothetical protein STANM309S_06267 [Streptomyces tanashiensis]
MDVRVQRRLGRRVLPRCRTPGTAAMELRKSTRPPGSGEPLLQRLGEQHGGQRVQPEVDGPVVRDGFERIAASGGRLQHPVAPGAVDQHVHGPELPRHEAGERRAPPPDCSTVGRVRRRPRHLGLLQDLGPPPEQQHPFPSGEARCCGKPDPRTATTDHHVASHWPDRAERKPADGAERGGLTADSARPGGAAPAWPHPRPARVQPGERPRARARRDRRRTRLHAGARHRRARLGPRPGLPEHVGRRRGRDPVRRPARGHLRGLPGAVRPDPPAQRGAGRPHRAGRARRSRAPVGRTTGTTGTAGTAGAGTACTRTTRPTGTALAARTTRAAGTTGRTLGPPLAGRRRACGRGLARSEPVAAALLPGRCSSRGVGGRRPGRRPGTGPRAPPFEPEPGPPERSEGPAAGTGCSCTGARCGRGVPGRGVAPVRSASERPPPEMSLSAIGVRMTTGGLDASRGC